jgi:hypothetical protein
MSVLVTGMHLSGGSIVARMLEGFGYYFGEDQRMLKGKNAGYREWPEIFRINNEILAAEQASWDYPKALSPEFWKNRTQFLSAMGERARRLITDLETKQCNWAIKDPRICLTMPFWQALEPKAKIILTVRDPFETAQSMAKRYFLTENYCTHLWEQYYVNVMQDLRPEDCLVLNFDQLLANPAEQAERMADWLAIELDETKLESSRKAIRSWQNSGRLEDTGQRFALKRFSGIRNIWEQLHQGSWDSQQGPQPRSWIEPVREPERKVIVHYHLYKNAGTSIDRIPLLNFGKEEWVKWEGDGQSADSDALAEFILANPEIKAVSTHLGVIRLPVIRNVAILPIIMLRHPLNRIQSVYEFEKTQVHDAPGPNKAKEVDLKGYVAWRMARPNDRQFSNFQTFRLSDWSANAEAHQQEYELSSALAAIQELPFIGCVETFDESMQNLQDWLVPHFPGFKVNKVHANPTNINDWTLERQMRKLKENLGADLFGRVFQENQDDLLIYGRMIIRYQEYQRALRSVSEDI